MKKLLKLTAVLTVIALLASCFAVFSVSAAVPTTTEETINEVEYDVYTVGTAQDLIDTVTAVNALEDTSKVIIRLSADITLNTLADGETWETKTNATAWVGLTMFQGIFDGNGNTISGLYLNESANCKGLIFKSLGCTVKDLTIDNSYIKANGHVGAIIGSIDNGATSTTVISNVKVTNTTINGTSTYVGGLVGGAWYALYAENVMVQATITGTTQVGGLVGSEGDTDSTVEVNNAIVNADITGSTANSKTYVAGLIGNTKADTTITNVFVNSNITGGQKTGGFVGEATSGTLSITNAVTLSTVDGGAIKHVGGMVGCLNGSTSNTFTNCISAGVLNATHSQAGMVVGFDWATSATFTNCYVSKDITGTDTIAAIAADNDSTYTLTINGSTTEENLTCKTRDQLAATIQAMGDATGENKYTLATEALAGLFGNDMVYAQIRESDNALRFVVPITGKDYKAVGMTITATYNGTGKSVTKTATTLYKTITETKDGATTHTTAVENEYFYCFVLTGAPEGVTFEITTFVTVEDGSAEGITYTTGTYTATYTAGTLK